MVRSSRIRQNVVAQGAATGTARLQADSYLERIADPSLFVG